MVDEQKESFKNQEEIAILTENVDFYYGSFQALKNINLLVRSNQVTAFIGPSGCGKSTFLRLLNRMNDFIAGVSLSGQVIIDGEDIYGPQADQVAIRRKVGMVFQKPNPFPQSIYDNVAYGPRLLGNHKNKKALDEIVEQALKEAALWEEVKDLLNKSAMALSGGQQQRLCIARALSLKPSILLMDEPTASLDPIATAKIEEWIQQTKGELTVVIVTHNMQQAARISDTTAFFYMGELIEVGSTERIFTRPREIQTENYITGRFG